MTSDRVGLRSPTEPFQHLQDGEVVLWGMTYRQVIHAVLGVAVAAAFALYLSPLPAPQTAGTCVLIAGLPPVLSWIATEGDVAPWTMTAALLRWLREPKRFAPGGSQVEVGYLVERTGSTPPAPAAAPRRRAPRLEETWEF
jgi:hypothetical protein